MKLEYTDGCICTSLSVDGVETIDMKTEDLQAVICKLVKREDDISVLQDLFTSLMSSQGEYKDLGQCEQCGDFISEYTLEID